MTHFAFRALVTSFIVTLAGIVFVLLCLADEGATLRTVTSLIVVVAVGLLLFIVGSLRHSTLRG